ncbi:MULTISPECIES: hypothetical protein [Candidatus Ichthyocystis]|nr:MULTISPECIES: hypothetical protein [Ichthyocystis]
MHSYLSGSNSNVDSLNKKEDIKSETNNENYDFSTEDLPKYDPSYNFLNIHNSEELLQDHNYQKRLLPPDIFKLNRPNECNLSYKTDSFDTEKPCTSRALKRILVEDVSETPSPSPKKIYLKPIVDDEKNHIFVEKTITSLDSRTGQNHSTVSKVSEQPIIKKDLCIKLYRYDIKQIIYTEKGCNASYLTPIEQITKKITSIGDGALSIAPKENTIKKNLNLKSYAYSNLWNKKISSGVLYRNAVKTINIDNNGLFKNTMLEKIAEITKRRDLLKSSIDLSTTYSNIRKFAIDRIYSLFDDSEIYSDISIIPGMSISDLRLSCISNNIFFEKLREYCEKIKKDILVASDNSLLHLLQFRIILNIDDPSNSANTKIKLHSLKGKFIPELKELIIETISNLPKSIVLEIEKIDQINILNDLFVDLHGVLVSKSLIKNMNLLFNSNKNKFADKIFDNDLSLFSELLEKIASIVRSSCIFHEGVFLPDEPMVEKLSRYMLSDMYGVPFKLHKNLKLPDKNTLKIDNFVVDENYAKSAPTIETKISDNRNNDEIVITPIIGNIDQSEQPTIIKEFNIKSHYKSYLFSAENTSNIYEDATKKISIDTNCRFKNSVLEELGDYITKRGFTKSFLDLSKTYSNVRKYVLDKVYPFINDAITTIDVLINPGMSLSDLDHNLVSNEAFFERLRKNCEEIAKSIHLIPNHCFSNIIQSYIYINSTDRLRITKKKKLCPEVKLLIIETISNLPRNIIDELKKFKPNEVIDGLFANIHNLYLPKSLIRKLRLIFDLSMLQDNKSRSNSNLRNNLLAKILSEVEICPVLHEGKTFSLGKHTAKILSKYLLSDMCRIPTKIKKKPDLHKHIKDNMPEGNYEKSSATNNDNNVESPLLEKSIKRLKWDTDPISPLNIYQSALSMIDIDKADFENSFIKKIRRHPSIKKDITKKEKINLGLSTTYDRVENYIFETFLPFLKEIEEETRAKIKPLNGMNIDKLRLSYVSNEEEFLDKLHKFCTKTIDHISSITLIDLLQGYICLGTKTPKMIRMTKKRKIDFHDEIKSLLVKNILNVPKVIVNNIKLIPNTKFLEEYFSSFYDICIDNVSLLKAKSVFDTVHKKVANDHLLIELIDKISLDMIYENSTKAHVMPKIVNSYIVCGELSTYDYIRELIKEDISTIKYELGNNIMIVRNDKIETADQTTLNKILIDIESDLIATTIKSYNKLCIEKYRSYKLNLVETSMVVQ